MRNDYFKTTEYLRSFLCLEISPLMSPILPPENRNTRFLDICSTEDLKKKYENDSSIDINKIVNVHYVHGDQSYKELVGVDKFGLVIASHVVEHVPNLINWLRDIESILLEGGLLQLAVPDQRYCFDFRRRLSNISDIMGAFIENRKKPCPRDAYDHFMFAHHETCNDPVLHHAGNSPKEFIIKEEYHLFATMMAEKSLNTYVDVHCWQFTPETFTALSNFLYENDLIGLKLLESETKKTQFNTFEFFVTLQKIK